MGQIINITGPNASGKTQRMETLRRQTASGSMRYIAFSDAYGPAVDSGYYLQLRWNQHDIDPEMPSVGDILQRSYQATGPDTPERQAIRDQLYQMFGLDAMLSRYVISLSSGELRKVQLTKALMAAPRQLILDNPYIGLDAHTRQQLSDLLSRLADEMDITIYLVEPVVEVSGKRLEVSGERLEVRGERLEVSGERFAGYSLTSHLSPLKSPSPLTSKKPLTSEIISMHNINIVYGGHTILSLPQWQVNAGEHWAIEGPNGSGKSTLLSLICGDNPQAYACDISLFGQQRGTGETIWQLKRRIGYVSPEMHRAYRKNLPAVFVVASGLKDTVGLYVRPTEQEREQCLMCMQQFRIEHLAQRPFLQMSSGEQRLVLLARAFVKNPPLLILDEPMHGLDSDNQQLVKDIIIRWAAAPDRTLLMVSHYAENFPPIMTHRLTLGKVQ